MAGGGFALGQLRSAMTIPSRPSASAPSPYETRFVVGQGVVLMGLWLVLSGHFDAFHIGLGAAWVAFVIWINRPVWAVQLGPTARNARLPIQLGRLLLYLPWLFGQMLSSGLYVAYLALHPRARVAPLLLRFRSHQPTVAAQVVLGNSITLTPGTLTLEIRDDEMTVHALTDYTADGFLDGGMTRRVARLFGTEPEPPLGEVRKIRSRGDLQVRR